MVNPRLTEEEKNRLGIASARVMVNDLVLRNILLKLNSKKANEAMKEQVLEQMSALKKYWSEKEMETAEEEGFPLGYSAELFEHEIGQGYDRVLKIGRKIVDGLFSPPTDVAGQM